MALPTTAGRIGGLILLILSFPFFPFIIVACGAAVLIHHRVKSQIVAKALIAVIALPAIAVNVAWASELARPAAVPPAAVPTPSPTAAPSPTPSPKATALPSPKPTARLVVTPSPRPQATATPSPRPTALPVSLNPYHGQPHSDKDCADFSTHAAAQAYFNENGGSPSTNADALDHDHDGLACETLP